MDYYSLKRKELQDLCKKHNLPANVTNLKMADSLSALLEVSEKVEKRTISSLKGSGSGSSGVGGDTKVAKTVRFLDQEKPNEGAVSKVAYQPEKIVSEGGSRTRRKYLLGTEKSSSDGPDSEETEAVPESHETSRRLTRSQAAKTTDAMAESEQAIGNGVGGTKVAKKVRFLDQKKPNEVPITEVTYQPEKMVPESGPRTRRKSLLCTKRSSSECPHSEETEADPENHETLRRTTRSQAAKAENAVAESEQAPVSEKEVKKRTRKPKNVKKVDKAIHKVEEQCPIIVTVLSSSEEDEKNAGKGDDLDKMIAPEITSQEQTGRSLRSRQVTIPAKINGCEASNEEALEENEQQQNSRNRRKTRKMMEKAEEETQSDGKVLISESNVHTKANDAKTKASREITCENGVSSTYDAGLKGKEEFLPEYGGNRVSNTSARTRSQKKLGGAAEEVSCEKENEPILHGKPSRKSRRAAAQKNESANFLEGDNGKSKVGNELQQAAEIGKAIEQIKLRASQERAHVAGATDEAGKAHEDEVNNENKILKRSKAPKGRKGRIMRFKKGFERQRDRLTSDCEGDQEDNADQVEAAEASATHEEMEMRSSDKELHNHGDVKHFHRSKSKRNSLLQNQSCEDLEIIEENNGLESISTQCEHPDLKIRSSIFDVNQTEITEGTDDREEMESMELIERRGSEIVSEHENMFTNLSDQEQDASQIHEQNMTDACSVDEGPVCEKKDEQLFDQHLSPCGRVNLQPGEYNWSVKEKGSVLHKSVLASETALTSPNRKTVPPLANVNVGLQCQMAVVVDDAIRKEGLFEDMHEAVDEENETLKAVPTVPEMLISDRVPNEGPGLQETSTTNAQFPSENNADVELIGSKEIVLNCVSSCMTPIAPAKEQSELGNFMSNGCPSFKDHNEDTIPENFSRPYLELSLGIDAVAESKEKQDIPSCSALMNKIISASTGQNDTGKSMTSLAITNIDLLNGIDCKEVEDANWTDEMVSKYIEEENESPTFTKETRYHGLTEEMTGQMFQTKTQESREIFVPRCGSNASSIITAMLHSDPGTTTCDHLDQGTGGQRENIKDSQASQPTEEVVTPKSSVVELNSEASEVPFLKEAKEDKYHMMDLSSEIFSTDPSHVFEGAACGGGKNIRDGCKETSSEAQTTNRVSESEPVNNTDSAVVKQQRDMGIDKSRKESNLEDLKYPKDERLSISYDLSQAIADESHYHANGCIMGPSVTPASNRIEKHTDAAFLVEAFGERYQNEHGNQHTNEVSEVKKTACSSLDDDEITAYDYFDMSCDNDSGVNNNKSSGSFNYFEEVDNGREEFSFYSGVRKNERNAETAHEEFDQKHGNEAFVHGDIRLVDFCCNADSFEGSESDIGSECTTQAHDAEQDSIKDDTGICLTTSRSSQFLFHGFISQHRIESTNTERILEDNLQTKSLPKKASIAIEGTKGCTSQTKVSEDLPDSNERNNSLVEERFSEDDENEKLSLHESPMEEGNHNFPVTEIFQDVPQIEDHKGWMETMDSAADQQKVELATSSEFQEVVQSSQSTSKEPAFDSAVKDVKEVSKYVFEECSQTEPGEVQDKNGTVESYSEELSLEDVVVVHTPVTEYQNAQRSEEHKHHSEIMDVDANQETVELVNQSEFQEAEECNQTEPREAQDKNGTVESYSEELSLEDAIVVHTPVTEYQNAQRSEEHKHHSEIMDVDANQETVELVNQRELQEAEECNQTEPGEAQDKNGTVESCSEVLSLEDAVVVHTPVTQYENVQGLEEHKHHSEIMDVDANQETVELVNQKELQEAEERSQSASKELDLDHCIIDVKQVNKFVLEEHDQIEPERFHDKNGTVESCLENLFLEDAVAALTPITKFCHHVQQFAHRDHCETMVADANGSMVEFANRREFQEAEEGIQMASKELDFDECAVDLKQVNVFVLEEHEQSEIEVDKNGTVESSSEYLILEDAVAFHSPVTEFDHHVQQLEEHKDHGQTMDAEANKSMVDLANQRELQEVDEGTQSASKELHADNCSVDVKQVNKFVIEDHNPTEPEGAQNQDETVESSTLTLGQEVTLVVHMPVERVCQYVLQIKEHEECRETMDTDGDRHKVELQEVYERAQSASKDPKLDYCAVESVEQVSKCVFQEHCQTEPEGSPDKNEDVESSTRDLSSEDQIVVYTPVKENVLQSGHADCWETMDADEEQKKDEHTNWEVLQEVEDSTQSASNQLVLDGAQDKKVTVDDGSQNLSPMVQTLVKEMCSYVLQIEEHKDCKETVDADSDQWKVEPAYENKHQEDEENSQSSPKVLQIDACAIENCKEVIKFATEEHAQTEPDEDQDRNEVVECSSQNLIPEDVTSFKEEDMKGTEDDRNEDDAKTSQLADVEEVEVITESSSLNPSSEGARTICEEQRGETSNSEAEDRRKIGKIELTEIVTDESYDEEEQLSRTVTTVLDVKLAKSYFQAKPENVGMSNDLKDKELKNGANRENSKANEASPPDITIEESSCTEIVAHANGEIAGAEDMEKRGNDEGDHSSYQPKSTEDGTENDELVHPERKGNDYANSPSYLSKSNENGKENDEVAQLHPVEAQLSTNSGGPPSGTDEIDVICKQMSMTLKISVPPPETSPNTAQGASPVRLTDEEAAKGVEAVSLVPAPTEPETSPNTAQGASPVRLADEEVAKGLEAVSPVPAPTEPETTSPAHLPSEKPKPLALTMVAKATAGAESSMRSPARRRNEEARKENTPRLTMGTKSTMVKEKRETATKTQTAARRRPLQAITGNNGEGFHGRLDFTR